MRRAPQPCNHRPALCLRIHIPVRLLPGKWFIALLTIRGSFSPASVAGRSRDSEQLLQDFSYRAELELFLDAAETVDRHIWDPAGMGGGRAHRMHKVQSGEGHCHVAGRGRQDEDSHVGADGQGGAGHLGSHQLQWVVEQANRGDVTIYVKSKRERGIHELPYDCSIPNFKPSQLVGN